MRFRNPWIDPRIEQVRIADLEAYLRRRGWRPLPDSQENFQSYEKPTPDNFGPIVNVPQLEHGRDFVQRVIEVVSDLARAEDRYAVEVLNDILASTPSAGVPAANAVAPESTVASPTP